MSTGMSMGMSTEAIDLAIRALCTLLGAWLGATTYAWWKGRKR